MKKKTILSIVIAVAIFLSGSVFGMQANRLSMHDSLSDADSGSEPALMDSSREDSALKENAGSNCNNDNTDSENESKKTNFKVSENNESEFPADNESGSDAAKASGTEPNEDSSSDIDHENEPAESLLPGHNTYFNGFKRLTNLTYDDVATVTDSKYSFTIGTYYDENYYNEQVESYGHIGGGRIINGCFCKWEDVLYHDIEIGYATYNPITRDYSGEHNYIGKIVLKTSRFMTAKGIHVGSSLDEVRAAYPKDLDDIPYKDDGGEECYLLNIDGVITEFFYDFNTQKITKIKLSF